MNVEDLKGWLREEKRQKDPVRRLWELLARLVYMEFG